MVGEEVADGLRRNIDSVVCAGLCFFEGWGARDVMGTILRFRFAGLTEVDALQVDDSTAAGTTGRVSAFTVDVRFAASSFFPQNVESKLCFPENSSQNFAAILGGSFLPS
jgi:hypothetical protein